MLVSSSKTLDGRKISLLGRVRATCSWRAVDPQSDREAAVKALVLEAEDFGADALIDVRFETDAAPSGDVEGVSLRRLRATGLAVRFAA